MCHLKQRLQLEGVAETHCCISDCCEHVDGCQTTQRINGLQCATKRLMKYVTDSCSTTSEKKRKVNYFKHTGRIWFKFSTS